MRIICCHKRSIRTIVLLLASTAIIFGITGMACVSKAEESFYYTYEEQKLYELGLYLGVPAPYYNTDLGMSVNRETAIVQLVTLFGLKDEALGLSDEEAGNALQQYRDDSAVSGWAKKYVAYAFSNGLVQDKTIDLRKPMDGDGYAAMILGNLGYTIMDRENPLITLSQRGGPSEKEAVSLNKEELTKDDLVGISYGALTARDSAGTMLIEKLIGNGSVNKEKAMKAGLFDAELSGKPQGFSPFNIEITEDGEYAYLIFDLTEAIFKIRLKDLSVVASADLSDYFQPEIEEMVMDADENKLFAYTPTWNKILVIDTETMRVIHTINNIDVMRLYKSKDKKSIITCNGGSTIRFIDTETYKIKEFTDNKLRFNYVAECENEPNAWYVADGGPGDLSVGIYDHKKKVWIRKVKIPLNDNSESYNDCLASETKNKAFMTTMGDRYPHLGYIYSVDLEAGGVKSFPIEGGAFALEENPPKDRLYISTGWPMPNDNDNVLVFDTLNEKIVGPIKFDRTRYNWAHTQINDLALDPTNPDILYATSSDGNSFSKIDLGLNIVSDDLILNIESFRPHLFVKHPQKDTGLVLIHESSKAFVLDLKTSTITDVVRFPTIRSDAYAYDAVYIDNGRKLLVAQGEFFLEVDASTMTVAAKHPLPDNCPSIWHFSISNDQKTIYSVNNVGHGYADTFVAIDTSTYEIKAKMELEGGSFLNKPLELPDSNKLYLFGGQYTGPAVIYVVDKRDFSIIKTIDLEPDELLSIVSGLSFSVVLDSRSNTIYWGTNLAVYAIDANEDKIIKTIDVKDSIKTLVPDPRQFISSAITSLVLNKGKNLLYISHLDSGFVSVYDLKEGKFTGKVTKIRGCFPVVSFTDEDYSKLYTINIRSDNISVIDLEYYQLVKDIELHGMR